MTVGESPPRGAWSAPARTGDRRRLRAPSFPICGGIFPTVIIIILVIILVAFHPCPKGRTVSQGWTPTVIGNHHRQGSSEKQLGGSLA